MNCWVLSDGTQGMQIQCLGLAEAMGIEPVVKYISPRFPWKFLPPRLWFAPLLALGPGSDRIIPPWPDLVIGTGRQSAAPSMAIRHLSRGATFTVQIQNPRVNFKHFDLVIAPAHDRLIGDNVLTTLGSIHGITQQKLDIEADRFRNRLKPLPRPLVAVLIGGANGPYRMGPACANRLADGLLKIVRDEGVGLAITTSRRTGAKNERLLRVALADAPAEFWDGTGENPYYAYLALADAFVVTSDSVNMASEAGATGKPVFVFNLDGGSAKFRRFHAAMTKAGITRPFTGALASWDHPPPDDMAALGAQVLDRMARSAALPDKTGIGFPRGSNG